MLGQHPPLISNVARGPIIDQPALVAALHDGRVASATLDVTDPEPLPADDPLWDAPNVIITPHIRYVALAETSAMRDLTIVVVQVRRTPNGPSRYLNGI